MPTPRFLLRLDHGVLPPPGGAIKRRLAVRAVVERDGLVLLVHSTVAGDWKFPGGGVEGRETVEEALRREIAEETGYEAVGRFALLGRVIERSEGREVKGSLFEMESQYFRAQVSDQVGELRLDAYEKNLGFTPRWVPLAEALDGNRRLLTSGRPNLPSWLEREVQVMQWLRQCFQSGA